MISLIIGIAIILAIAISYKSKVNTGLFALAFSYVIGCFILKMKTADVIAMWPISIFFVILATSLFYNFAVVNGTLEKVAVNLLYGCRKIPLLLPFVILFIAVLIAALGAGYFSVMVLLVPLTLILCKRIHLNPLVGAMCVNYGAMAGASFMVSANGVIYRGLITAGGYGNDAFSYAICIFIVGLIIPILVISGLVFANRNSITLGGNAGAENVEIHKPEPFDQKQRINLWLIIIMVLIVLIPPILHIALPHSSTITFINSKVDVGLVSVVFAVIAAMLHLADSKKVIARVPWSTLIMISGIGILVAIAIKAGTVKLLANWVGMSVPTFIVPVVLCIIAAVMAFFSSLIGVVIPALFPVVPLIAHATGLNPMLLYTCVVIGAQAAAISPFSAGGSMIMGYCETEEERTQMFSREMFKGVPVCLIASVIMSIILSAIIH